MTTTNGDAVTTSITEPATEVSKFFDTPFELDFESVYAAAREIVAERPDFIYAPPSHPGGTCLYRHEVEGGGTVPGCIVGQIFEKIGVPIEIINNNEGRRVGTFFEHRRGLKADRKTTKFLVDLQTVQDQANFTSRNTFDEDPIDKSQFSWGSALRYAEQNLQLELVRK